MVAQTDTDAYHELSSLYLAQELAMFRQAYQYRSTDEATTLFRCLAPEYMSAAFSAEQGATASFTVSLASIINIPHRPSAAFLAFAD
jgi:hypothetical protein